MNITPLTKEDLKPALDLIMDVFMEFEAPEYSEEGINEFKTFNRYEDVVSKFEKGELCFWGCRIDDRLAGVIAVRDISHICLLFVRKEYHRRGIARALFNQVLGSCQSRGDVSKITVNSSPYAVNVYHRLGFLDTNTEQTVNGIRFTPMEYHL